MQYLADLVAQQHHVGGGFRRLFGHGLCRVEKHSGAEAAFAVVALEHVVVHTSFASFPEFGVVGELGNVTGMYPMRELSFMTGSDVVMLKILA